MTLNELLSYLIKLRVDYGSEIGKFDVRISHAKAGEIHPHTFHPEEVYLFSGRGYEEPYILITHDAETPAIPKISDEVRLRELGLD